jgi:hypothetical protein
MQPRLLLFNRKFRVFCMKSYQLGGTFVMLSVINVAIISTSSCKTKSREVI